VRGGGPVTGLDAAHRGLSSRLAGSMGSADRQGGGKAIRPVLALLSARADGGHAEAVVPAAVAVELAHNPTLLHHDVMDGDRTRRYQPNARPVFVAAQAARHEHGHGHGQFFRNRVVSRNTGGGLRQ
jgi:polyprenyl synthetase